LTPGSTENRPVALIEAVEAGLGRGSVFEAARPDGCGAPALRHRKCQPCGRVVA